MKFDVLAYPKLLFDVLLIEFEVSRGLLVRFFFRRHHHYHHRDHHRRQYYYLIV